MITIILIRHAESMANVNKHLVGGRSTDTPLSDRGAKQAAQLGAYLYRCGIVPDQIISSPAQRATETARLSLMQLPTTPIMQIREEVHEMSQGAFEGMPRDEVYTPEIKELIDTQGKDFALPDGGAESMNDVADRIDQYLQQIVSDTCNKDKTVLIYTHGIAICCYVAKLLNLDQQQTFERIRSLPNASLTTLRFSATHSLPEIIAFGEV